MNIVVIFQSLSGATESLALAAAVGAVQGRASIRLRWLAEESPSPHVPDLPQWRETRERMSREYVAPREADAAWADAILAGLPDRFHSLTPEFVRYFQSLRAHPKLAARFGGAFTSNTSALEQAFASLGLSIVPFAPDPDPREAARLQGRRAASATSSPAE